MAASQEAYDDYGFPKATAPLSSPTQVTLQSPTTAAAADRQADYSFGAPSQPSNYWEGYSNPNPDPGGYYSESDYGSDDDDYSRGGGGDGRDKQVTWADQSGGGGGPLKSLKAFTPLLLAGGAAGLAYYFTRPTEKSKDKSGNPLEPGSPEWDKAAQNALISAVIAGALVGIGVYFISTRNTVKGGADRLLTTRP